MADLIPLRHALESSVELWMPIPDLSGYDVSNLGRVRSWWYPRRSSKASGFMSSPRLMKPYYHYGYPQVILHKNRKPYSRKIHRLVALSFVSNPMNKPHINHINCVRSDARADNLEWVTPKENMAHAVSVGRFKHRGSQKNVSKLTEEQVLSIRERAARGEYHRIIAADFNVDRSLIGLISRRRIWTHI